MNRARNLTGNDRLRLLHGRAEVLHINFYETKDELDQATITEDLTNIAEMLDILEPLTDGERFW